MVDGFGIVVFLISILAGGIASIAGFGIGSLLTPLVALKTGASLAVAAVSIAHLLGTALRFWKWKKYVDRRVLFSFGLTSALGGLIGAVLHNVFQNGILTIVFGCLLVFAGTAGLTGVSEKWQFKGMMGWVAGAISGLFGGLVGNQGGVRSAAMLGFDLDRKAFVATATGIALAVDFARMPVYFAAQWRDLQGIWPLIMMASVGVIIGTQIGVWVLGKIPEKIFKKIVSGIILLIGVFVLAHR